MFQCAAPLNTQTDKILLKVLRSESLKVLKSEIEPQNGENLWCAGHVVNLKGARVNPQVPREP